MLQSIICAQLQVNSRWNATPCGPQIRYKSFNENDWNFLPLTFRRRALKCWPAHANSSSSRYLLLSTPCVQIFFRPRALWQSSLNSSAGAIIVEAAKHIASVILPVTVKVVGGARLTCCVWFHFLTRYIVVRTLLNCAVIIPKRLIVFELYRREICW